MVKSDRIEDVNSLQLGHIENGLRIGLLDFFDLYGSSSSSAAYALFPDGKRDGAVQVVLTAVVPESLLSGDKVPMYLTIDKIYIAIHLNREINSGYAYNKHDRDRKSVG